MSLRNVSSMDVALKCIVVNCDEFIHSMFWFMKFQNFTIKIQCKNGSKALKYCADHAKIFTKLSF